jgi:hypothetical protein
MMSNLSEIFLEALQDEKDKLDPDKAHEKKMNLLKGLGVGALTIAGAMALHHKLNPASVSKVVSNTTRTTSGAAKSAGEHAGEKMVFGQWRKAANTDGPHVMSAMQSRAARMNAYSAHTDKLLDHEIGNFHNPKNAKELDDFLKDPHGYLEI